MLFLIAHLDAPRVGIILMIRVVLVAAATREKDSRGRYDEGESFSLVGLFSTTLG